MLSRMFVARKTPVHSNGCLLAIVFVVAIAGIPPTWAQEDTTETPTIDDVEAIVRQDPGRAEELAEILLQQAIETHGAESMEVARVYDLILECRFRSRSRPPEESIQLANDIVALKQRVGPSVDPSLSATLYARAILNEQAGHIEAAEADFLAALSNRQATLGADHPELARAHRGLGIFYTNQGREEDAREHREAALRVAVAAFGEVHLATTPYRAELAASLIRFGDSDSAREQLDLAMNIIEASDEPPGPDLVRCLNLMVEIERGETNFEAARRWSSRAVEAARSVHGPRSAGYAWVLNSYGLLLAQIGDYRSAQEAMEEVLAVRREVFGPDHPQIGFVLSDLAKVASQQGQFEQAVALYEESLSILSRAIGEGNPDVAQIRTMLASTLISTGDSARAVDLLKDARSILERQDPGGPAAGYCDLFLAQALADEGRVEESRAAYESAVGILERRFGRRSHHRMAAALKYAEEEHNWGGAQRPFEMAQDIQRIMDENLRLNVRTMSERQALQYVAIRPRSMDLLLSLAGSGELDPSQLDATWDAVVRSRGLVLDELGLRNHRVFESTDPEIKKLADEVTRARLRLAELFVAGRRGEEDADFERELKAAAATKESAENALAQRSAGFQVEQRRSSRDGASVIDALPASSCIVSYVRFTNSQSRRDEYGAFVHSADRGSPAFVALGGAARIDELVRIWKDRIQLGNVPGPLGINEEQRYRLDAQELAAMVWEPLTNLLGDARTVFVVPAGSLQVLSLATLPASSDRYLVESETRIHYLSSERDLVPKREIELGRTLLAVGDVDFESAVAVNPQAGGGPAFRGARSSCRSLGELDFDPLPATGVEIETVSNVLREQGVQVMSLLGSQATERAFKREVAGSSIVHLATHGFFLRDDCNNPDASVVSEAEVAETTVLENPLLLSGLVLAGANDRDLPVSTDDGVLTAEEIATLDLSRSEWVVLSACDTGLGIIRTWQGVFGLRRAFMLAGARTLLMSLWMVEDEAALAWMQQLYDARFQDGMSTAESVRAASLRILEQRRAMGASTHPFHWGAFVATGDWN